LKITQIPPRPLSKKFNKKATSEQTEQKRVWFHEHRVQFVASDVTSFPSLAKAFKTALDFHPLHMLNIVVPNAGVATGHEQLLSVFAPERFPLASLDADSPPPTCPDLRSMDVNLKGVIYTVSLAMHYFRLPGMQARTNNKAITFVSSMAGYTSLPGGTLYMTSKFGVRGLFHSMRKYVGSEGVRVNLVAPTYVRHFQVLTPPLSVLLSLLPNLPLGGAHAQNTFID
jgi:5'-hydroxyaverantin dehydrogenase